MVLAFLVICLLGSLVGFVFKNTINTEKKTQATSTSRHTPRALLGPESPHSPPLVTVSRLPQASGTWGKPLLLFYPVTQY